MAQLFQRRQNSNTHFFREWTRLTGLTLDFEVTEPSALMVWGHLDVHHRGLVNGVIGYAGCLCLESADTLDDLGSPPYTFSPPFNNAHRIAGSTNGGNILSETDHYGKIIWSGSAILIPKAYRLTAYACSHSSLDKERDGLAEVLIEGTGGLNLLNALITPL
jgi:hypothetical protein